MLFAFEFMCMVAQEQLYTFIAFGPSQFRHLINLWWAKPLCWLFGRLNICVSMAFAFLTFGLVKKEIWINIPKVIQAREKSFVRSAKIWRILRFYPLKSTSVYTKY
uniref:Uncharacterized protein n=1 Tax=Meloidogyne incognita TaxID=6306 RepID=A0A914N331_MELIC